MTNVTAQLRYYRMGPRKMRLLVDLIRGKKVTDAQTVLSVLNKKGAKPLLKLLNSAVANAKNNFKLDPSLLFVEKIEVNDGPKFKRMRPRARGQGFEIQKKTSHIILVLNESKAKPKL